MAQDTSQTMRTPPLNLLFSTQSFCPSIIGEMTEQVPVSWRCHCELSHSRREQTSLLGYNKWIVVYKVASNSVVNCCRQALGRSVKSPFARRSNGRMTLTFAEIIASVVTLLAGEWRMCLGSRNMQLRLLSQAHFISSWCFCNFQLWRFSLLLN